MRLHQVALRVADLDAAERFYRDVLGARFVARFDPPGLLFFDFDGVRLLLEAGEPTGGRAVLYLRVADIDAACAEAPPRACASIRNPTPSTATTTVPSAPLAKPNGWPSSRTRAATPWRWRLGDDGRIPARALERARQRTGERPEVCESLPV